MASNWRRDTVDLTPFKDTSVIIRFVGYSSNGTPIYLDNIRVEAGFAKDVSVLARIFPDTTPICFPQRHVPLRVAIRNDGFEKADTFKLSYRLDTEGVVSQTFIKRLNFRDTAIFTFSQLMNVVTVGNHNLTISVAANGDFNGVNDTLQSVFRLRPQYKANISEGLEGSNFPPQDWTIQHTEPDARTWEPIKVIGSNGDSTTAAFLIQQTNGTSRKKSSEDVLTTYPVDLSNIANPIALFDLSYFGYTGVIGAGTDTANTFKAYYNDTLRVDISTDCGQTFKPTGYKKTKVDLTTALRTYNSLPLYGPKITEYTDWRREVIDLSAYKGQVVQLRFVHIAPGDAFTNTLYLDNFQFINYEDKNISLLNWVSPNDMSVLCSEEAFPVEVRLVNEGRTAIDSFDIKYQIDNLPEIKELAQLKLNTNETKAYRFENLLRGVKSGEHTLRVVIHIAGDTISAGDTLVRKIMVGANYTVPVIETFEPTNTINFPPQDWHIEDRNFSFNKNWGRSSGEDRDGNLTYTAVCYTNQSSLKEQDALTTWNVNLKNMKNPYLIFDIAAYSTYLQNFDTFRIDYSTDCGYNFKPTVYKKYNAQFNTAPNPNSVSISFPKRNQWRSDSVRLFNLKDSVVQFRFFAIVKPTFGMVIHLDNVRVIELPVSKTEDINDTPQYSHVFPNPTTGNLIIQFNENLGHEAIDCQLKNIQGQIVKHEKLYNTNQNNWNLNDLPAGMYFLFVGINNQFDRHKIILIK